MLAESLIFQTAALACLLPALWLAVRRDDEKRLLLPALALAVAGPVLLCVLAARSGWRTDFSFTIWVSAAATLILFSALAAISRTARKMAALVLPYLGLSILVAILVGHGGRPMPESPGPWLAAHIAVAVATYALITVAAVAALAVFLKERSLKSKTTNGLAALLPPVAESERLQDRLMFLSEAVLGLGLASGIAIHVQRAQPLLEADHKTLLTLAAFVVIGILLIVQRFSGLRGRRAARIVLISYLLVTMAYPGVKFVSDILIG